MPTFHIIARFPSGQFRGQAHVAALDAYSAIVRVSKNYTWGGQTCDANGNLWTFNPTMTVDGVRACDIVAEHIAAGARSLAA